jgi:DNA-binding Lrp family transcriptional regulator
MRVLEQLEQEKRVKLDLKDKKILALLAKNARTPATKISKIIGLSRDGVRYRIRNLMQNHVIQGYRTLVDVKAFGFEAYHVFIQLNTPSKEVEKQIIEKFKAYPFIRAILKFSDKYDYEIAIIAKTIVEFDSLLTKIIGDCAEYLQDYEILIITNFLVENSFPKSFLEMHETSASIKAAKIGEKLKLDEKDVQIINILANNASLPLYAVANKTKMSADSVKYRLNKMLANQIIKKFIPVINYASLGYTIYAVLLTIRGLSEKKEAKLKELLMTDKNVLWAVKTIGRYNVLLYLCVPDVEEFHKSLINIRTNFQGELNHYETLVAYEEYKYTYFPEGIKIDNLESLSH